MTCTHQWKLLEEPLYYESYTINLGYGDIVERKRPVLGQVCTKCGLIREVRKEES